MKSLSSHFCLLSAPQYITFDAYAIVWILFFHVFSSQALVPTPDGGGINPLSLFSFAMLLSRAVTRVSSETSFVSYFAKHETKQVSCFAKQTCRFAKFRFEAKLAVSHVSLFFKRNETARFACFVTIQLIPFYIKSPLT
jgi:hypothetical protein